MCIPNYHIYRTDCHLGLKGGTAVAVGKSIPHTHVDLPPFVSIGATGVCIAIGNREDLTAAVYKPPSRVWSDAGVTGLLNFRGKSILADDLNDKTPVWNGRASKLSGVRPLDLQDNSDFQISATQRPTHCTPQESGDVLDIVVRRNVRFQMSTVSDILESDHLPILFHILDQVGTRDTSAPAETHTDWERFRSLASDLISPKMQIDTAEVERVTL
jgi:hypothetical protein